MKRTLEVSWEDPMRLAEAGRKMAGIEFLRAIRDGKLPHPPICALLITGWSKSSSATPYLKSTRASTTTTRSASCMAASP